MKWWLAVTLVVSLPALAEVHEFSADRVRIELLDSLVATSPRAEETTGARVVATFTDRQRRVAIARVDVANLDAWRGKKTFFERVERSLARRELEFRLLWRKIHRVDRVPALDIAFYRRGPTGRERVTLRALFFWQFSITVAVASPPSRSTRREDRTMVETFRPIPRPH